jgi:hypothetical protein
MQPKSFVMCVLKVYWTWKVLNWFIFFVFYNDFDVVILKIKKKFNTFSSKKYHSQPYKYFKVESQPHPLNRVANIITAFD